MKELEYYKDDIYKCSRCGLCQAVCPVFKASLNECAVSRGKFNILNGIIKRDLNLTKNVKKYLDLCTGCNACKDFCPSKINAKEIFLAAKIQFYKENKIGLFDKILNSYSFFKFLLICAKYSFFVYRIFCLDKIFKFFIPIISKMGIIGKRLILLNNLITKDSRKILDKKHPHKSKTAFYFKGCFNKYLNSETLVAVKQLLSFTDINLVEKDFECCGVSYYNDGNIHEFKKLIAHNLSNLKGEYDYLITDCASCYEVLRNYKKFSNLNVAKELSSKVVMVTDLIMSFKFNANTSLKVAIHKPCHDNYKILDFVKNIKNINFVDVDGFDTCCGFSGKFALQNEEISKEISKQKTKKYIESGVDIILTTCPACVLGLNQGLIENNSNQNIKVMNLFVFLANYCDLLY